MKLLINEPLDCRSLLDFYRNQGLWVSDRQLWDWEKDGLLRPHRISPKRKLYPPLEVQWIGVMYLLRMAGKGMNEIRELRKAFDSIYTTTPKTSKMEKMIAQEQIKIAELGNLLEQQKQIITAVASQFRDESWKVLREQRIKSESGIEIIDQVKRTKEGIEITEVKRHSNADMENIMAQALEYKKLLNKKKVKCHIKIIREKKGLSQTELATLLDISQAALSKFENGWAEPDDAQKGRLADLLKVKVGSLFPK